MFPKKWLSRSTWIGLFYLESKSILSRKVILHAKMSIAELITHLFYFSSNNSNPFVLLFSLNFRFFEKWYYSRLNGESFNSVLICWNGPSCGSQSERPHVNVRHPSCHWTLFRSMVIDKLNWKEKYFQRKNKVEMPHAGRAQDVNTESSFVYLV